MASNASAGQPAVESAAATPLGPAAGNDVHKPTFTRRDCRERPLHKMSVDLIETYKQINKVYYEKKARAQEKGLNSWDDENYDYVIRPGEEIKGRWIVRERIGKGSFGQVIRAYDMEHKIDVAIKIIKSKKPFMVQARTEIDILNRLGEADTQNANHLVRLTNQFEHRGHPCLVFEMLSYNLYELLKNTHFKGVSLNLIRKFGRQILTALQFLAQPSVNIIHCDLKPENILLCHPKRSAIKVIDFGSSCLSNQRMYSYIQSRFYRSPEVMLGIPYTCAIDMWSLGCILVEMHTGEPLFSGVDSHDQMYKMVQILGMPPNDLIAKAEQRSRHQFFKSYGPDGRPTDSHDSDAARSRSGSGDGRGSMDAGAAATAETGYKYVLKRPQNRQRSSAASEDDGANRTLRSVIGVDTQGKDGNDNGPGARWRQDTHEDYLNFLDLITRMLTFDPDRRITPTEALSHRFVREQSGSSSGSNSGSASASGGGGGGGGNGASFEPRCSVANSPSWSSARGGAQATARASRRRHQRRRGPAGTR
mmetsp:Transcript_83859/g.237119  ORF Transcript_83859/g.237119 Transcript_83859/m.237119 type:complete len:534 (+) Transcript_83859:322-1923(+)